MMQKLRQWMGLGLLCAISQSGFTNSSELDLLEAELSQFLNTQQKIYVAKPDTKLAQQLNKQAKTLDYQVGWVKRPKIEFTESDYKGYKNPILLKMTVAAEDGRIIDTEVVKSSGSKVLDQKVIQALASAQLEAIPNMERNVLYSFMHEFSIQNS